MDHEGIFEADLVWSGIGVKTMIPFVDFRRQGEVNYMFSPVDPGECISTLFLFIVLIHGYGKLFTYYPSTEVIPASLLLMVNCFVFRSMYIG